MSALPHGRPATPANRDVVVPGLLLIVAALAIACGWQRAEYRRLAAALPGASGAPSHAIRQASAQSFIVAPHVLPAAKPSARPNDDGGGFAPAGLPFAFRPNPAEQSPVARLLNNPDFFQALQLHRQSTLDTRFAPLFRQLSLSPDELTAFKRLLIEKENAAPDVIAISESQPEGPLPDSILGASVNAARARADSAILTALGADRSPASARIFSQRASKKSEERSVGA